MFRGAGSGLEVTGVKGEESFHLQGPKFRDPSCQDRLVQHLPVRDGPGQRRGLDHRRGLVDGQVSIPAGNRAVSVCDGDRISSFTLDCQEKQAQGAARRPRNILAVLFPLVGWPFGDSGRIGGRHGERGATAHRAGSSHRLGGDKRLRQGRGQFGIRARHHLHAIGCAVGIRIRHGGNSSVSKDLLAVLQTVVVGVVIQWIGAGVGGGNIRAGVGFDGVGQAVGIPVDLKGCSVQ